MCEHFASTRPATTWQGAGPDDVLMARWGRSAHASQVLGVMRTTSRTQTEPVVGPLNCVISSTEHGHVAPLGWPHEERRERESVTCAHTHTQRETHT